MSSNTLTAREITEAWKTINLIDKTQHAFIQTGRALLRFRDEKMWRVLKVASFEEGCKKRWGWTIRRAQQYLAGLTHWEEDVEAAKAAGLPAPPPPQNERQSRKMIALSKANHGSPFSQTVPTITSQRDYSDAYTSSAKAANGTLKDSLGYPVPDHILPLWQRGVEIGEMMTAIRSLKLKVTNYEHLCDPLFKGFNFSLVQGELGTAWDHFNYFLPEVVCYLCETKLNETCALCGGRGFITKHKWDRQARKEDKETRPCLTS